MARETKARRLIFCRSGRGRNVCRISGEAERKEREGGYITYLNVVIEGAVLFAVLLEKTEGIVVAKVFKLNQNVLAETGKSGNGVKLF